MSFSDLEISLICVSGKEHVTGLISDTIIGVCSDIIEKLFYCFVGGFSGEGLFLSDFTECDYEFVVHSTGVV